MAIIMLVFVNEDHFSQTAEHADAILGNRASYAHALSPVGRVLGRLLWDQGPITSQ